MLIKVYLLYLITLIPIFYTFKIVQKSRCLILFKAFNFDKHKNKQKTYINKISNTLKIYFSFFFKVNKNLFNSFEYFLFTKILNPLLVEFKVIVIIILTKTRKTKLNIFLYFK